MPPKSCQADKILNPKTNRCVLKTGKIGKQLLKQQEPISSTKEPSLPQKGDQSANNLAFLNAIAPFYSYDHSLDFDYLRDLIKESLNDRLDPSVIELLKTLKMEIPKITNNNYEIVVLQLRQKIEKKLIKNKCCDCQKEFNRKCMKCGTQIIFTID